MSLSITGCEGDERRCLKDGDCKFTCLNIKDSRLTGADCVQNYCIFVSEKSKRSTTRWRLNVDLENRCEFV